MKKIDRETVQRILDTAEIVDVVSDFVSLKRRGSGYIGLCPFHNERTPSFSVSPTRNICKCFSCGKGGSPVNFIMELEKMTYYEALRYLANKYHIEIKEREMTDKEREEETERESMLAINDWAMKYFESTMADTADGRDIGRAYFLERGINEQMIKKFHLGYALDERDALYKSATQQGFTDKFLLATGLCSKSEKGYIYDRFRGRVIYPVLSVSGKVVAFGGRTLRSDKTMAKYVNSPESMIYSKSRELYGLYQAKNAIVNKDKLYLVEGYMDVISMFQSGVENVVASSGTSLTVGQIRLLRRFSKNVTVIYDSDAAGIKASLRGIDLLLAEGLNVKVLQFPDGDDPDSYTQSHSTEELNQYLANNEVDFIRFKTRILLDETGNDPIKRASVISSICQSIAQIPELINRTVYIGETARMLGIDEKVLSLQVAKNIADNAEKKRTEELREAGRRDIQSLEKREYTSGDQPKAGQESQVVTLVKVADSFLAPFEREVLRYILRYGMVKMNMIGESPDGDDASTPVSLTVLEYIRQEMQYDSIAFTVPVVERTFEAVCALVQSSWDDAYASFITSLNAEAEQWEREGVEKIRLSLDDMDHLALEEQRLRESIDVRKQESELNFRSQFISKALLSSDDDEVRSLTTSLVSERYVLSKVHSKYQKILTECDRLEDLCPRAVLEWKDAILEVQIRQVNERLRQVCSNPAYNDNQTVTELMARKVELLNTKREFAKWLGERVLSPRK